MAPKKTSGTAKVVSTSDHTKPANISPASEFNPSGAPVQQGEFDPSHPAVDDNPREHTTEDQNRIDLNDPSLSGSDAVAKNLKQVK